MSMTLATLEQASERVAGFLTRLTEVDPGVQATPEQAAAIYRKGFQL